MEDAFNRVLAIAAWSAYQRYSSLLCGSPSPRQKEDLDRLLDPQVGDLVVEISSLSRIIGWENHKSLRQCIGVLVERPEGRHSDGWVVRSLAPEGTETNWENCNFIAIDAPPVLPVCEHCHGKDPENCPKIRRPFHPDNAIHGYCAGGRWVYPRGFTRESLTKALAADGIEVKPGV